MNIFCRAILRPCLYQMGRRLPARVSLPYCAAVTALAHARLALSANPSVPVRTFFLGKVPQRLYPSHPDWSLPQRRCWQNIGKELEKFTDHESAQLSALHAMQAAAQESCFLKARISLARSLTQGLFGDLGILPQIIDKFNFDPSDRDSDGEIALLNLALECPSGAAVYIKNFQLDQNIKTKCGENPLIYFYLHYKSDEVAAHIDKREFDPTLTTKEGENALFAIAERCGFWANMYIHNFNFPPNLKTKDGENAEVATALRADPFSVASFIHKFRIYPETKTVDGENALFAIACEVNPIGLIGNFKNFHLHSALRTKDGEKALTVLAIKKAQEDLYSVLFNLDKFDIHPATQEGKEILARLLPCRSSWDQEQGVHWQWLLSHLLHQLKDEASRRLMLKEARALMRPQESYESAAIGLALASAPYSEFLGIKLFRITDQARTKEGERALSAIALAWGRYYLRETLKKQQVFGIDNATKTHEGENLFARMLLENAKNQGVSPGVYIGTIKEYKIDIASKTADGENFGIELILQSIRNNRLNVGDLPQLKALSCETKTKEGESIDFEVGRALINDYSHSLNNLLNGCPSEDRFRLYITEYERRRQGAIKKIERFNIREFIGEALYELWTQERVTAAAVAAGRQALSQCVEGVARIDKGIYAALIKAIQWQPDGRERELHLQKAGLVWLHYALAYLLYEGKERNPLATREWRLWNAARCKRFCELLPRIYGLYDPPLRHTLTKYSWKVLSDKGVAALMAQLQHKRSERLAPAYLMLAAYALKKDRSEDTRIKAVADKLAPLKNELEEMHTKKALLQTLELLIASDRDLPKIILKALQVPKKELRIELNALRLLLQLKKPVEDRPSTYAAELQELFFKEFDKDMAAELREGFVEKFSTTFGAMRRPSAIVEYAMRLLASPEKTKSLERSLIRYIKSVLNGTFVEERRHPTAHTKRIFAKDPTLQERWQRGCRQPLEAITEKQSSKVTLRDQLKLKILNDNHLNGHSSSFISKFLNGAGKELLEEIKRALAQEDISPRQKADLEGEQALITALGYEEAGDLTLASDQLKIAYRLYSNAKVPCELVNDIKWILDERQKDSSLRKVDGIYYLCDTDDPYDLLLCGTEVDSCQRVDGEPYYNKCLLEYILGDKYRLLAIKDREGVIKGRAMLRLLWDEVSERPVAFMERIYPSTWEEGYRRALTAFAFERARFFGVTLVSSDSNAGPLYPHALKSLASSAPYEYVDAADKGEKVQEGVYTLSKSYVLWSLQEIAQGKGESSKAKVSSIL